MAEPIELQDFLKWTPPKLIPVISDGLMYAGSRVIVYGRYKSMKSMVATRCAISISRGEDWLGFHTTKSSVMYLQLEVPDPMLHKRISKMMLNLNGSGQQNLHLWNEASLRLDTHDGYAKLAKMLDKYHPQVLIIDPIYKVVDMGGSGGDITSHIQRFVDWIDELVVEYQLSLMLVHHRKKGEREEEYGNADDMLGSSIFLNWADSIIRVERQSERSIEVTFDVLRHAENEIPKRHFELDANNLDFVMSSGKKI